MSDTVHITAFYHFMPLAEERLTALRGELLAFGAARGMGGLTLVATEGINGTVCGSDEAVQEWKDMLTADFPGITFKDSQAEGSVFKRWSVKIKREIVGLKRPDILPAGRRKHLTPAEWRRMSARDDVVILDARNDYEYALGRFRGAVNPGIRTFQEFPAYAQSATLPKDKPVLMYCTGGIRCEKALIAMEERGYRDVYQLEGGILGYLEEFPEGDFEGECFVFDQRVAVDGALQPSSTYGICPHCGLPGDRQTMCARCDASCIVCAGCADMEHKRTCSKRCANEHLRCHGESTSLTSCPSN